MANSIPIYPLAADASGCALWRNNSGAATGPDGRPVRYGLGNVSAQLCRVWKSSDWIGIGPGGLFLAVEAKSPGWLYRGTPHERAQLAFINNVRRMGGIAGFATCEGDFYNLIHAKKSP